MGFRPDTNSRGGFTLLVVSDTHGDCAPIRKLLRLYSGKIDAAAHLGDGAADLLRVAGDFPKIIFYAVSGFGEGAVCDAEKTIFVCGKKILMTHGHMHHVKASLERIAYYAMEKEADACLFGHTHMAAMFTEGPVFFMNPGSVGRPAAGQAPGYGLLRISDGGVISGKLLQIL
ncbi:MAG: YfcE family phosphodiesterase [Defluviitaleaceae bacterium]|nr:YfcE family phosphodiesterase [Defluviitaleaceae bacterium]